MKIRLSHYIVLCILFFSKSYSQTYCIPFSSNCTTGFTITNVSYGSLNNNSACGANGYTNYTTTLASTPIMQGSYLPISVTIASVATSRYVYAFIDFNQNGDFETPDEYIALTASSGTTFSGFVKVPFNVRTGNTRMRVFVNENSVSSACFPHSNSETEDYLLTIIQNTTQATGHVIYVKATATGSDNTGRSWTNALSSVNRALQIATTGDTIKVAKGTYYTGTDIGYKNGFTLHDSLVLLGGYPNTGNPSDANRNFSLNQTILKGTTASGGSLTYHSVYATGAINTCLVDGFIMEAGGALGDSISQKRGSGISVENNANIVFKNCVVRNTPGYSVNSTIAIYQARPQFYNCIIEKNSNASCISIEKGSSTIFHNLLVAKNQSDTLFRIDSSNVIFKNSTIASNVLRKQIIVASNYSSIKLSNSITYFNGLSKIAYDYISFDSTDINLYSSTASLTNCITQTFNQGTNLLLGQSPKFTDTSSVAGIDGLYFTSDDGFSLQNPFSPAINAGSNTEVSGISTDILGNPRIFESIVDIGAYELQQTRLSKSNVIYVKASATGLNNGTSWANAFKDLHDALKLGSDTIKIAQGDYSPYKTLGRAYWLENKTVIWGGYPSTGSPSNADRNYMLYPSKINGLTNYNFIENTILRGVGLDSSLVIDGITLTNAGNNGNYVEVGVLKLTSCNNPIISNCTFTANNRLVFQGTNNKSPLFLNCSFNSNINIPNVDFYSHLVSLLNCVGTVFKKCTFSNNVVPDNPSSSGFYSSIISNRFSSPMFDSCTFSRNNTTVIYNDGSNPGFINCSFLNNYGKGLIYTSATNNVTTDVINKYSNPSFSNCSFRDSFYLTSPIPSNAKGGILYNYISNPVFTNCKFDNGAGSGGVAWNDSSLAKFSRCVFTNCTANFANINHSNIILSNCISDNSIAPRNGSSFMTNTNSNPLINNCTIVNGSIGGVAVIFNNNSSPQINNSILWKNLQNKNPSNTYSLPIKDIVNFGTSNPVINNSSFEYYSAGGNNTSGVDPRLVNYANPIGIDSIWFTSDDGLMLCDCSPAINGGNNSYLNDSIDIANQPRVIGSSVDKGAYEFQSSPRINSQRTFFVNVQATGDNSGTSWLNAYKNLQSAIRNPCTDTIKIAEGIYKPAVIKRDSLFIVNRNLTILGSYSNNQPGIRDVDMYPTILSGDVGIQNDSSDNTLSLMKVTTTDSIIVDGINFRHASQNLLLLGTSALSCKSVQKVNITNSRFSKNYSGGASISFGSNIFFDKTVFNENYCGNDAALTFNGSRDSAKISNCIFDKNNAFNSYGGAVNCGEGQPKTTFSNCLFNNNIATKGAGIYIGANPDAAFINCTFVNNKLNYPSYGAGMYYNAGTTWQPGPSIVNCLFTGNSIQNQFQTPWYDIQDSRNTGPGYNGEINLKVHHTALSSYVYNGYGHDNISVTNVKYANENNAIGSDGKWFTADDGLHLSLCSDGLNKGDNTSVISPLDLAYKNRIFNTTVDMGAYEFNGSPEGARLLDTPNDSLTANKEFTDADGWTHYYKDCYYLMSIKKRGQNIGSIGDGTFTVKVKTTPAYGSGLGTDLSSATYVTPGISWKVMNRYWKVTPTNQPADSIQVSFPYTNADFKDVQGSNSTIANHQQMVFYKVDGQYSPLDLNVPPGAFHQYFHNANPGKTSWTYSPSDTVHQATYYVQTFSGGGGGSASIIGESGSNGAPICPGENKKFFSGFLSVSNAARKWQVDTGTGFINVFNSPVFAGVTSDILQLNNPPTSWYGYKFRCVIDDGSNIVTSQIFELKFSTMWLGMSNGSWENPINWSCNALPDYNTDVTINPGSSFYPVLSTNTSVRSLTVKQATSIKIANGFNLIITGK